jgi:tetratricopeptide (TPR) repeat protein
MTSTLDRFALLALLVGLAGGCSLFCRDAKLDYRTVPADPNHDTDAAKSLNERALTLLGKGKPDKAEEKMQKALIADVAYGPAHNNLGKMYFSQEKYYLAAWEFEYAVKLMPDRPEPYNNLGLVFEAVGKFNEAIEAYESARKLQATNPEVIGNLARARIRRGDPVADVHPLLADLTFFDSRPCWVAWAKEQLMLSSRQPTQPSIEMVPNPPEPHQPSVRRDSDQPQQEPRRLPAFNAPRSDPQALLIGSPGPGTPAPMPDSASRP